MKTIKSMLFHLLSYKDTDHFKISDWICQPAASHSLPLTPYDPLRSNMFSSELLVWSLFFIIHLAINTAAAASAICYFPDGSVAKDHEACSNINSPSACCEDGSICLTNGFCLDQMSVSRHSCTDRTWQDPACPLAGGCYQGALCPTLSFLRALVIPWSRDTPFTPGSLD